MSDTVLSVKAITGFFKDLKGKGKVKRNYQVKVNYIGPDNRVQVCKGELTEDYRMLKIIGMPGMWKVKHIYGPGPYEVYVSYRLPWTLNIENLMGGKMSTEIEITPKMLEDIYKEKDIAALMSYDYTLYLMCFLAGCFIAFFITVVCWFFLKIITLIVRAAGGW